METTSQSGQGRETECASKCLGQNGKRNFCMVVEKEPDCESSKKGKRSRTPTEL